MRGMQAQDESYCYDSDFSLSHPGTTAPSLLKRTVELGERW